MHTKNINRCLWILLFAMVITMSMAGIPYAATVTYNLTVGVAILNMPDATPVLMWGFGDASGFVTVPGPLLVANEGDTLVINLTTNNLPEPVTVVIPGQTIESPTPVMEGGRVRSFVPESGVFTFPNLKAGTYLYESGTNPAKQVQMGLYGVLIVRPATAGQAYNDPVSAYDREHVVVFSDIDPALHAAVQNGSYGTASYPSTANYQPSYFLINGSVYPDTTPLNVSNGDTVLLRFVNAGLKTYDPMLNGLEMTAIAEDGNLLPNQESVMALALQAGKTKDVIVTPAADTQYALYDRRLHLSNAGADGVGGMLAFLRSGWPIIDSFTATPTVINLGSSSTLDWQTTNATSVSIDHGLGAQPVDGSVAASPITATTYTLTATNAAGVTTATVMVGVIDTVILTSMGPRDGTVRESNENSNVGGAFNSTFAGPHALRLGDDFGTVSTGEMQYKTIISFDTSTIPDNAVVLSATLALATSGTAGTNPFTTHGTCYIDIASGSFNGNPALENADFQVSATTPQGGLMLAPPLPGGILSQGFFNDAGLAAINKTGLTQMRLYFSVDDNDNNVDDWIGFYSGENATPDFRPVLTVTCWL